MAMEATEFAFPMDAEECEEGYDREYNANDFARYFRAFITSGIIADGGNIAESLQLVANDDMTTTLKAGNLIIDGYRYELMKDMVFQHRAADGVLDRIDRISITLDTAEREIHAILREGEYSYKPVAPQCRRTSEYMDYVVADVRIVKGAIKVTQANITDTRLSTELCGIAFPFWKLDTGPFFAQLNSFYNEFVLKSDRSYDEFVAWAEEKKAEIITWQGKEAAETDAWQKEKSEEFDVWVQNFVNQWESWLLGKTTGWQEEIIDWFDNLKEHLEENAAVQLQLQIGNLENLNTEKKEDLVSAINSLEGNLINSINDLTLSYAETMAILSEGVILTAAVTLVAPGGTSVEGQTVTLHNVATGKNVIKKCSGGRANFEVYANTAYTITVSDMEDDTYVTPEPVDILIEDEDIEVNIEYKLKTFNDLSWSKIINISESGRAGEFFKLHDEKEIILSTGEKVVVEIVGFNHDILASDESKTAGITFGTKNCISQVGQMTYGDTNISMVSWKDSYMRKSLVGSFFYDILPEEIKNGIKKVRKKTVDVPNGIFPGSYLPTTMITTSTTEDDVWLFSPIELGIAGVESIIGSPDETMYPAFSNNESRIKRRNGSATIYYTRTPQFEEDSTLIVGSWFVITQSGGLDSVASYDKYGVAVGFCI